MNKINGSNVTDEELLNLLKFLSKNAIYLASDKKIETESYYLNDDKYKWIIVEVKDLGIIKLYLTDFAKILKINNWEVSKDRYERSVLSTTYAELWLALKNRDNYENSNWFFNI